jgi:polysaccharide pyruvyl transferase WcaK-like protein
MRVGIVGNYGHDNNGDEAILAGILDQINNQLMIAKENNVIFSNNPVNTFRRYGVQSEPLIIKTRNIISSLRKTSLKSA